MTDITRIETDKLMADFGRTALMAKDWERDGLGIWKAFEMPPIKHGDGIIIAAPKHEIDKMGCSVFFQKSVNT